VIVINKTVLIGRLTADPILKFLPGNGTANCTFTLAVDRRLPNKDGVREADFIPIVVWGKQAESTANYMIKGKLMGVAGRIQTRSYDAKDGTKRYVTEVVAEEVQFLEYANSNNGQQGSYSGQNNYTPNLDKDITPIDDGDIPFN
jgi:single-strand DNA-binding protein